MKSCVATTSNDIHFWFEANFHTANCVVKLWFVCQHVAHGTLSGISSYWALDICLWVRKEHPVNSLLLKETLDQNLWFVGVSLFDPSPFV